jgi:hypothetical protein
MDLSDYGGYIRSNLGLVFKCLKDGSPTWKTGSTLMQLTEIPNALLKPTDANDALNYSYGSGTESLISTIVGDDLIVNSNDFNIVFVDCTYVRIPAKVNYTYSINCDLPITPYESIVDITAKKIMQNDTMRNASANGQLPNNSQQQ